MEASLAIELKSSVLLLSVESLANYASTLASLSPRYYSGLVGMNLQACLAAHEAQTLRLRHSLLYLGLFS
jgi:hypothetical protein